MITFDYERLETNAAVQQKINECEGKHVQQVAFSSFMGALTQICFTCRRIRGVIHWQGNQSWGGERHR